MSKKITANPFDYFLYSEGCIFKDGALTPAYTAVNADARLPEGTGFAAFSPATRFYYACDGNGIYVSGGMKDFVRLCDCDCDANSAFLIEDYLGDIPRAIVVAGDKALIHSPVSHTVEPLDARLSCGAAHCGRLFGADADDKTLLRWSGTGGADDWDESLTGSGYLHLDAAKGNILGVLPFGEKLVAVREYGITLLNTLSDPEKFAVNFTDFGCSKVAENTACTAGGKLFFFTETGLRVFDGSRISRFKFRHENAISLPRFCIAFDGKYYVACRSALTGADVVCCVDTENGESCITDVKAERFFIDGGVTLKNLTELKRFAPCERFSFKSKKINFGTYRQKTLTEAYVDGECDITISCERGSKSYVNASGLIRPKLRGGEFEITVSGGGDIFKIGLCAEVMNGI